MTETPLGRFIPEYPLPKASESVLGFWAAYNRFLAHVLAAVPEDKRGTPCWIGNNPVMSLEELAADYLTHLEHHLDQIRVNQIRVKT